MQKPRVLIAEPAAPIANALRIFLEAWCEVQLVSFVDEAVESVRARPPDVLIAAVSSSFDGEALAQHVRKQAPETALVLVYPSTDTERAPQLARDAGAEAFLVLPLKKHVVLAVVQAVTRLHGLALQVRALQAQFAQLKVDTKRRQRPRISPVGVNAPDDAFFKKYMLLEVKRSKRYQYPVSVLLVALDKLDERLGESAPEFQRAAIRAEALESLSALLRDIDVAMPFAEDKYLVFLPHTALKGSTVVAGRIVERLRALESFSEGTASVGVAAFEPKGLELKGGVKEKASFGALVREASAALSRAQSEGGNRFSAPAAPVTKRSRISLG